MKIYYKKQKIKVLFVILAIIIGIVSLWYTNYLMNELSLQEHKRIKLWSQATQELINSDASQDVSFIFEVLRSNDNIPVILTDLEDNVLSFRNIDSLKMNDIKYSQLKLAEFKNNGNNNFTIYSASGEELNKIYYSDSSILIKLYFFPFVQLMIVSLYIILGYFAFSVSRKTEQNQVWLGMAKETAHQLGTPISSLTAWVEILNDSIDDKETIKELNKDVKRLEKITARFSKIGSKPSLEIINLPHLLINSVNYMQMRISKSISIKTIIPENSDLNFLLNPDLFEWVIENICKNAIDAIETKGEITIKIEKNSKKTFIDFKDNGKGIPKSKFKTIFNPGYTTKSRGWGLGLSLSKRIINEYHNGKLYVKQSEIGKGTTIRIVLNNL